MIKTSIIKKSRLIATFVFLLLVFGSVAVVALLAQQRAASVEQSIDEAKHNLEFLSNTTKQFWLNKDYTNVEKILIEWGMDNHNTHAIRVVAANGYELVSYKKLVPGLFTKKITQSVMDNKKLLFTISLDWDLSTVEKHFIMTRNRFIAGVAVFASILGLTFWGTLRKMVFVPLEQEFNRRVDAEEALQASHDALEERVSTRTRELWEKNLELQKLISDRDDAESRMKKLSSAIEQTEDIVVITDSEGIIEYVNPAFEKISGYSLEEVMGKSPGIVKSDMHEPDFYKKLWETISSGEAFNDVFINHSRDGTVYYEEKTITPLKDKDGNILNFVATGKNITERIKDQESLQFMATHDALTELPNRTMLKDRLMHAMDQAERLGVKVVVMFLDLDRFKNVNDSLGHPTGDSMLKQSAKRLSDCVRKGDTIARLGGDEFTVVMEGINDVDSINRVAQKIITAFKKPFSIDGYEVFSSTSIGITVFPDDGTDIDTLLKNADTAMYRAKSEGGNSYQYYTHDMTRHAIERLEMHNQLLHALERDEFRLHYQPRIDLASGEICGMEALIRWENSKFGMVMPDKFIPILEESDQIVEVGKWVIREACEFNQFLKEEGLANIRCSVNLSARQFRDHSTLKFIEELNCGCRSLADCIEVEITETMLVENIEMASYIMDKFHTLGIKVSVDDFGTGYSSMSYLKRFPLDALKIDRSFVEDIPGDHDDVAITQAIIALGHSLNLRVIAEGVETEEQYDFLKEQGCDEIQGFLISRAIPEEEFKLWLVEHLETVKEIQNG